MAIAVLTWKLHNFGTALQAYALVNYLSEKNAADGGCVLLNYSLPGKEHIIQVNSPTVRDYLIKIRNRASLIHRDCKNRKARAFYAQEIQEQKRKFQAFYDSIPHDTHRVSKEEYGYFNHVYKKIVVGSDQVWNPKYFCDTYFLDFVDDGKKYSYAASIGVSSLEDAEKQFFKDRLGHFQGISVRECSGQRLLKELLPDQEVACVLDPTLLLSGAQWSERLKLKSSEEEYILVYTLSDNPWYKRAIQAVRRELGINKTVYITPNDKLYFYDKCGQIKADAGPVDFLNLVKNAAYVITDSFHGVCFSLNFEKQFVCMERFNSRNKGHENARITDLLDALEIRRSMLSNHSPFKRNELCYSEINVRLSALRKESDQYISWIVL